MLGLGEALKWIQIGACAAIGFHIVRGVGWLVDAVFITVAKGLS